MPKKSYRIKTLWVTISSKDQYFLKSFKWPFKIIKTQLRKRNEYYLLGAKIPRREKQYFLYKLYLKLLNDNSSEVKEVKVTNSYK